MIHRNNGSHGANKPCTKGGHIVAYFSLALLGAIALGACAGETAPGKGSVAPAAPTVAPPPQAVAPPPPVAPKAPIKATIATENGDTTLVPGAANVVNQSVAVLAGSKGLRVLVQLPMGSFAPAGKLVASANGNNVELPYSSVVEVQGWTTVVVQTPTNIKPGDTFVVALPFALIDGQWATVTLKVG